MLTFFIRARSLPTPGRDRAPMVVAAAIVLAMIPFANAGTPPDESSVPPAPRTYMGRTIATTMHYDGAPWLVRGSRAREEGTALMLEQLDIRPGMTICDMGCGNGYYTIPLAKRTGPNGRVYAVDIQEEMLRMLEERAGEADVENIALTLGTVVDPKLPDASIDLMLLVDVYHEMSHPRHMLTKIRRSLKPGGRLVLVEFRAEDPHVPIKPLHKMSRKQILKELNANGFKLAADFDGLPWQHMMTFVVDPTADERSDSSVTALRPLKVFVLAGQSNMEGHARVETFDYIGDDPATAPLLEEMMAPTGGYRVCDDVWISYLTGWGENGEGFGKLTAGYGSRPNPAEDGGRIGPEFTFGIHVDKAFEEPILIIKTAWGGKSLHTDFRSPGAGPYQFTDEEIARYERQGKNPAQVRSEKDAATGRHYRLMIEHVKHVLGNPARVCPEYVEGQGVEIAGFVWFQGWNDMVDSGAYPNRANPGGYDRYTECMAHFIRDVRADLATPDMPFVIGVMGVGGPLETYENQHIKAVHANFRAAMAATADLPEFRGNVTAVQTAPYWDEPLAAIDAKREKVRQMAHNLRTRNPNHANRDGTMSEEEQRAFVERFRAELISPEEEARWQRGASNAGYHYLGCAKTMALIGKAFAEAVLDMQAAHDRAGSVPER